MSGHVDPIKTPLQWLNRQVLEQQEYHQLALTQFLAQLYTDLRVFWQIELVALVVADGTQEKQLKNYDV